MDFAVKPAQPVNLAGAVTIAGTVPVSGNVGVPGGVDINGNIPVIGAITSQTVASGATSTTVVTSSNGSNVPLTTTIITGSPRQLELHSCMMTLIQSGGTQPITSPHRLIRSDTGADIMTPLAIAPLPNGTYDQQKDFEGALLPAGVSVQSIVGAEGFGPTATLTIDINYTVVG